MLTCKDVRKMKAIPMLQLFHFTAWYKGAFEKEGSRGGCKLNELVMSSSWVLNCVSLFKITPKHIRGRHY